MRATLSVSELRLISGVKADVADKYIQGGERIAARSKLRFFRGLPKGRRSIRGRRGYRWMRVTFIHLRLRISAHLRAYASREENSKRRKHIRGAMIMSRWDDNVTSA